MKERRLRIHSVPPALDQALRERAQAANQSVEDYILEILKRAVQAPDDSSRIMHRDLDFAIGSWVDDPEFDAAMKEFDKIDDEMWK